jgi:hypothetical protein
MIKYFSALLLVLTISLFAEKVSFKEIENVAINYYRERIAKVQYKQNIIKDFEKVLNPDSIKYELDSLVIDSLTVSYFFNFKPTGFMEIYTTNSLEPVPWWELKGSFNTKMAYAQRNDSQIVSSHRFDKTNPSYIKYYDKPSKKSAEMWNKFKIDPKEFKIKIPYKVEKVSLNDVTNIAINYYRELFIRKNKKDINLDSLTFELDSLIYEDINLYYIFNFEPKGFVLVSYYTSVVPIYDMGVNEHFDKQAHLNNKERIEHEFQTFNYFYSHKPEPRKEIINQWKKLNVNPKEYNSSKIHRYNIKDGADVAPVGGGLDSNDKKK